MKTIRVDARDLPKSLDLATGEAYKIIIEVLGVEVVEMEDIHFHHASAVVLPWRSGENVGTTPAEERMSGLSVIVGALRHAKANPGKKVLLAGHADSSGGADYNRKLSRARAEATQALLAGDKAGFAKVCAAYQKVEDLQQALAWVAEVHDWPCHPGAVDNAMGSKTEAARHAFRKRYNEEFSGSLALDGPTSAADWKAMFDLYELGLADELGDDLKAGRAALTMWDPPILACGEDFAAGANRPEGMRSASDRRVDILFLDPGKPLHLGGHDYQSDFEVPTGETTGLLGEPGKGGACDKRDWYYLRHRKRLPSGVWQPGGMGFAKEVVIQARPPGTSETTGLSPWATHNGKKYFAGRLVIFTRAFDATTLDENETIATIVHEFTHAFGYPHKCGYYGWPKPPSFSCAMNYNITWLYVVGTRRLHRFMYGTGAPHLCSKHLAGVREVHLEDNPAIWTWKDKGSG
jgi:hypothetical protein